MQEPTSTKTPSSTTSIAPAFFGVTVVRSAFVLAMFGWGLGFYGPPIYLHQVVQRTGLSLSLVSTAVTLHFLFGAFAVALLPRAHQRIGLSGTTLGGAMCLVMGLLGWSLATSWSALFAAAMFTGMGWATMGGAAINAMIAPWYERERPLALAKAYNGASVGGMVFPPLLAVLAQQLGPVVTACLVGAGTLLVVGAISWQVLRHTPDGRGQFADGNATAEVRATPRRFPPAPDGQVLRKNRQFQTLAAGMALGLFAQAGMIAHLYSLLVVSLGPQGAAGAMTLATGCAILGRTVVGKVMPAQADRRLVATGSYAVQLLASLLLLVFGVGYLPVTLLGVVLFGLGIGNATSLPPLIAQSEFSRLDCQRVVALVVAISQATFAFAPVTFALVLAQVSDDVTGNIAIAGFFAAVAIVQCMAGCSMLLGRQPVR